MPQQMLDALQALGYLSAGLLAAPPARPLSAADTVSRMVM